MMLAFANAATKNAQFNIAYSRTLRARQSLQSRLKPIEVGGRFRTLGFVIGDFPLNFFKVNLKADDSLFQVFVGYDLDADYPFEQPEKVTKMIAGWLRHVFRDTDGYAAMRPKLLEIVSRWEEEIG